MLPSQKRDGWEMTIKQAEELAKTLGQMKFVLQGTQGRFLDQLNCVQPF
jgi:hypothetical protein